MFRKMVCPWLRYTKKLFWAAALLSSTGALPAAIRVSTGPGFEPETAVFFAFDPGSVPFRRNLQLTLVPAQKHPEPVERSGAEAPKLYAFYVTTKITKP